MMPAAVPDNITGIASTGDIIAEARAGRMFILTDAEDRENEGDLVIAAEHVTAEAIAFMSRKGGGLICLALDGEIVDRLKLPLIGEGTKFGTPFTLPIGAREGTTTGISAADRAHTIKTAIAPGAGPQDIITPGHVFPLRSAAGGLDTRRGHTEGTVEIMRRAGLAPAAVICEIMNDDGTMARMPDLAAFARRHEMKIGTIADLVDYCKATQHKG